MTVYDCIVLGTGGLGSAASYYAARRGWRVLGLDRFEAAHARGSSHGRTRIIRQAYYEHPNYVPLALETYRLWAELEATSGQTLYQRTGLLQVGDPDGAVIQGVRRSAEEHQLSVESLDASDVTQRWPIFNLPATHVGLFEEIAGYLAVEKCVGTFLNAAQDSGAELIYGQAVKDWRFDGGSAIVQTESEQFTGRRLIICSGAWASQLLPELKAHLRVIRKHQHWFDFADQRIELKHGFPTYLFETDDGCFYGFPKIDDFGAKISEHSGGEFVDDPTSVDRDLDPTDLQRVERFARQHINAPQGVHLDHSVCMYTMSTDEHFIVDMIPAAVPVAYACGMSGHGFKFAPVIGQYLVQLVDGERRDDMEYLRAGRFVEQPSK